MPGHLLGNFEFAAVLEIRGDAGCAEGVTADPGFDAGFFGAPLNHAVYVRAPHRMLCEQAGLSERRTEERTCFLCGDTRRFDVLIQIVFEVVMARHLVELAVFLLKAHPPALRLFV